MTPPEGQTANPAVEDNGACFIVKDRTAMRGELATFYL
jgi:hypothetical protein